MKYMLALIEFILILGGCASNACSYSKWEIDDGWSYSSVKQDKFPNISFEYPGCFQKLTESVYKESPITIDTIGDTGDVINHTVEFGRSINRQEDLKLSYKNGSLSKIRVELHTSDWLTGWATDWNNHPSSNGTFLDYLFTQFSYIWQSEFSTKQITVGGFQTNSAKYFVQYDFGMEQYRNRITIMTFFPYNDKYIEISMDSWEGEAEEVEKYYNHLLQTFKVVD